MEYFLHDMRYEKAIKIIVSPTFIGSFMRVLRYQFEISQREVIGRGDSQSEIGNGKNIIL
ncbi:hypothetical protein [Sulfuricurvum sp.]|uniref:hypothetical protein n=1 Tax=Sulfuricurvum sp. TaxID=2025608 RepID=UPI00356AD5DE